MTVRGRRVPRHLTLRSVLSDWSQAEREEVAARIDTLGDTLDDALGVNAEWRKCAAEYLRGKL